MSILSLISIMSRGNGNYSVSVGGGSGSGSIPPPITSSYVPVYIYAGQSNTGRSRFSELSTLNKNAYTGSNSNVYIYNYYYNTSSFTPLNPGINTMTLGPSNLDEMGLEVSFAKELANNGIPEAYFIKVGIGNTDLATYWLPPSGTGFVNLKLSIDLACQYFYNNNLRPELKGFFWMQGENDATNQTWANNYKANLETFFSGVYSYWETRINLYSLPTTYSKNKLIARINGINDGSEVYRDTVRIAEHQYYITASNSASFIDTDSYSLRDYVHYSADAQIQFGLDAYQAFISGTIYPYVVTANTVNANTVRLFLNTSLTSTLAGWDIKVNNTSSVLTNLSGSGTSIFDFTTSATLVSGSNILHSYNASSGSAINGNGKEIRTYALQRVNNTL